MFIWKGYVGHTLLLTILPVLLLLPGAIQFLPILCQNLGMIWFIYALRKQRLKVWRWALAFHPSWLRKAAWAMGLCRDLALFCPSTTECQTLLDSGPDTQAYSSRPFLGTANFVILSPLSVLSKCISYVPQAIHYLHIDPQSAAKVAALRLELKYWLEGSNSCYRFDGDL